MTTWITAPGSWANNSDEIIKICLQNFGHEHLTVRSTKTGKSIDNHGNWELRGRILKFRYQKDYAWFMLQAYHLRDPEWKYGPFGPASE